MAQQVNPFRLYQYVYKSRKFILEMLEDRGFDISNYESYTMEEIKTLLASHESNGFTLKSEKGPLDILVKSKNSGEKIFVKYRLDDKFRERENLISQINDIYSNGILQKSDCLIIMNVYRVVQKIGAIKSDGGNSEFVRQLYITKGIFVQIFGLENFLFNVSRHQFVPKHTIATKEDISNIMTKYNIKNLKNLPMIKWQDPQAKYIGLKPKMVTKIITFNATTGDSISYRVCVF